MCAWHPPPPCVEELTVSTCIAVEESTPFCSEDEVAQVIDPTDEGLPGESLPLIFVDPACAAPGDEPTLGEAPECSAAGYSPAGCVGQSNSPHKSSTQARSIKGYAQTSCPVVVPELYLEVSVWKQEWYGYKNVSGWFTAGNKNIRFTSRSALWSSCVNDNYRTTANHYSFEQGNVYHAQTNRYAAVTSC